MKSETEPITDDEWLLRRVRIERFRSDQTPIISPNAFEPRVKGRDIDAEGISLYRESCLTSAEEILATVAEDKRSEYDIVRVSVAALKLLNLSVKSAPDSRIRGHVVIPELNATDYEQAKAGFTQIKFKLAEIASEEGNILVHPTVTPPKATDSKDSNSDTVN